MSIEQIQEQIRQYAIKVFKAVDGHGLSRVDFFLDKKTNKIYLNEINTMPGFTKISMYPQLMNDFGITYPQGNIGSLDCAWPYKNKNLF